MVVGNRVGHVTGTLDVLRNRYISSSAGNKVCNSSKEKP